MTDLNKTCLPLLQAAPNSKERICYTLNVSLTKLSNNVHGLTSKCVSMKSKLRLINSKNVTMRNKLLLAQECEACLKMKTLHANKHNLRLCKKRTRD